MSKVQLLSVAEAAEILSLDTSRVRQLIRAGKLPCQRVGKGYVLTRSEVEEFAKIDRPTGNPNFGKKSTIRKRKAKGT